LLGIVFLFEKGKISSQKIELKSNDKKMAKTDIKKIELKVKDNK